MLASFISQAERLASGGQGWQIGARRDRGAIAGIDRSGQRAAGESVVNHGASNGGALGKLGIAIGQDVAQFQAVALQVGGDIGRQAQGAIRARRR